MECPILLFEFHYQHVLLLKLFFQLHNLRVYLVPTLASLLRGLISDGYGCCTAHIRDNGFLFLWTATHVEWTPSRNKVHMLASQLFYYFWLTNMLFLDVPLVGFVSHSNTHGFSDSKIPNISQLFIQIKKYQLLIQSQSCSHIFGVQFTEFAYQYIEVSYTFIIYFLRICAVMISTSQCCALLTQY